MTDKSMTSPSNAFMRPPASLSGPEARYAILPIPYGGTVSYKGGTEDGPAQILDASEQVEWFDEELLAECVEAGIATHPPVPAQDSPELQMQRVREAAEPIVRAGKFLLSLGGEHSITAPLVEAVRQVHGPVSVLQIDAHADLRDCYGGSPHSHACVMRRLMAISRGICQIGIRNVSLEEYRDCPRQVERFWTPAKIRATPDWIDQAIGMLSPKVYLTIDIDGFDPAYAPGTGTPEPGGLDWLQVTGLLRELCRRREVVAADIIEVRPIPPNHVTEFLAARLAYKIIAYTQQPRDLT